MSKPFSMQRGERAMGRWDSGQIKGRISIPRLIFLLLSLSMIVFTLVSSFISDPVTTITVAEPLTDIEIPGMKKPLEPVDVGV